MAGCVLKVQNRRVKAEELLSSGIFTNTTTFQDGFNFTISESEEFSTQLSDSEAFLKTNTKVCKKLTEQLQPDAPVLDFGFWKTEDPVQSVTFPSSLVELAGSLGFELCASFYEISDL
ncbi:MAG: hypothetical protein ACC651_15090, partial [Candidatus Scalindua sp.]